MALYLLSFLWSMTSLYAVYSLDISMLNRTNTARSLASHYGTLGIPFVAQRVNSYLTMDNAIDVAATNTFFNHIHNVRMEQLFGAMNNLLVRSAENSYCCINTRELEQKLMQIPTFKKIKVNISSLFIDPSAFRSNYPALRDLYDKHEWRYIRGIDASSDLPFLLFILSVTIDNQFQQRQRLLIVIFNQDDIHFVHHWILQDNHCLQYFSWPKMTDMNQIIIQLNYDAYRHIPDSEWFHRTDVLKQLRNRNDNCDSCNKGLDALKEFVYEQSDENPNPTPSPVNSPSPQTQLQPTSIEQSVNIESQPIDNKSVHKIRNDHHRNRNVLRSGYRYKTTQARQSIPHIEPIQPVQREQPTFQERVHTQNTKNESYFRVRDILILFGISMAEGMFRVILIEINQIGNDTISSMKLPMLAQHSVPLAFSLFMTLFYSYCYIWILCLLGFWYQ